MTRYHPPLLKRLRRNESGASAAEFALVLPIMTVLLFGAVDVSGLAWAQMQVGAAARAGATYALTYEYDEVAIGSAVTGATGFPVTAGDISQDAGCPNDESGITLVDDDAIPCPDSGEAPGEYVTVNADGTYNTIFGWPGLPDSVDLSARSQVRIS